MDPNHRADENRDRPSIPRIGTVRTPRAAMARCRPARDEGDGGSRASAAAGWSFCIVTDGRRPGKLRRQIRSIRRLRLPRHEILVAGAPPRSLRNVVCIPMPAAAAEGRLGAMRTALVERARFERLVVCDDDILFDRGFCDAIERHRGGFDGLAVRVLNPDGSRYWDRCTIGGARGHRLLRDDEAPDPGVYLSGAIAVLRRDAARRVGWDATLGFYENEDVDFSRRFVAAGYSIGFCAEATVVHDDVRYRQSDLVVYRFDGRDGRWHRAWGRVLRPITLARIRLRRAGRPSRPGIRAA